MQLGFIGLGKMGGSMVHRIHRDSDHRVVAFDMSAEAVEEAVSHGASGSGSLEELVGELEAPRHVWVMVPAGDPTGQTVDKLADFLDEGDAIIDGGNSRWTDSRDRGTRLAERGLHFVDVGTSGGVWGLEVGYCMMVGGSDEAVGRLAPILDVLAPPEGWGHMGPTGSGHYVKMVHNGVEYGMMQAYAEGFEVMYRSDFDLDLGSIAHLWNQGGVVRSWLLELAERAFAQEGKDLDRLEGYVQDSGEGRWTVLDAMDHDVPTPVMSLALMARFYSRQNGDYTARMLAALRNQFGGHAVKAHDPAAQAESHAE
jgi:6-phosphogluconate dehydrogenase